MPTVLGRRGSGGAGGGGAPSGPAGGVLGGTYPNPTFAEDPPGTELDYAQITADVSITATVEASAVTIVAGNSVAYDGTTLVMIEFWAAGIQTAANSNTVLLNLWEDSTDLGTVAQYVSTAFFTTGVYVRVRRTPTAASHTYTIKGWRTTNNGTLLATSATYLPAFIRVTKV